MNPVMDYIHQSLATAGFAIIDVEMAATLRPDIILNGVCAASDIGAIHARNALNNIPGLIRLRVKLAGQDRMMLVVTRSTDMLADRIQWITGGVVEVLEPEEAVPVPVSEESPIVADARKREVERLAKLRALAAQEPPAHECHMRREIFKARAELAAIGG